MPNYRIPNNSNDDANGIWKMNAVQRARQGSEWPDPFVPIPPSAQYYFRRQSPSSGTVTATDGTSTNAYGFAATESNPGTANLTASSWGFSYGPNTDAISFMVTNSYGNTGTYQVNRLCMGAMNNFANTKVNNDAFVIQFLSGTNTNGSGLYYKEYAASTWTFYGYSTSYANYEGLQLLALPPTDTYGNGLPNFQFNTWYTVLLGWTGTSENFFCYSMGNSPSSPYERTITLNSGQTATMHWSNPTYSGSGWRSSSNGTSVTSGQLQMFGAII